MTVINRTNLCTNPSFETNTTGWVAQGSHPPTISQVTNSWPGAGTHSLKLAWPTTVGLFDGVQGPVVTTVIGQVYTGSVWVFVPSGTPPVLLVVAGLGISHSNPIFDQWFRLSFSITATGTSHQFSITSTGPTQTYSSGAFCYIDAMLVEQTGSVLPYFDGDTLGGAWTGTAELSTSTFTAFSTDPSLPLTVIEFDAMAPTSTDFILDSSLLDGSNLLTDSPRYVNVATQGDIVNSVVIQRGLTDPNGDIQPGFCTINCDNWSGSFDPENLQSVFNKAPGNPYLVKGMLGRFSAIFTAGGTFSQETLFVGRLEDVALRKGLDPDATLHFVDDLAIYGTTAMESFNNSVRSQEQTGSRAKWLTQIGRLSGVVPTPILSVNLVREMVPTYGGGQILDEFVDLVHAEVGRVFVDRNGILHATAHADDFVNPAIATLSDNVVLPGIEFTQDLEVSSGTMQVSNAVVVHRYGQDSNYPDISSANLSSIARYGRIQVNGTVGWKAPLFNDVDVQTLADYLANRRATPTPRIDSVTVDFTGNVDASPLFKVEIGCQIVISRTVPYIGNPQALNLQLNVEGIQWAMTPDTFTLKMVTSPTDSGSLFGGAGVFLLDSSLLDGADVLSAF